MRVLLTSFAHTTHFQPLVPLAWALRAAGHEVRVASQPALTDVITGSGLTAVPVGRDHEIAAVRERMAGEPRMNHPATVFPTSLSQPLTWEHALGIDTLVVPYYYALVNNDSMIDDLVAFARGWQPDLVLWEPTTYAGAIAARVCGAAHARLMWSPDVVGDARVRFLDLLARQPAEHREDPLAEWLTWTLRRFGSTFDEEVVTGQWTIDPTPPSLRPPTGLPTLGMRYVPYNGPSVVPPWLHEPPARPRICLTLGISAREGLGPDRVSVADLVEAIATLDVEVVATLDATQRARLPAVPANVRVEEFVPLQVLLPSCAAVIHHNGAGTYATAMSYGVPQIIVPDIWDGTYKAKAIAELGAGVHVDSAELTVDAIRKACLRALEPEMTAAARRLREETLREPSPAGIVGELERLTNEHARTRTSD